jgi:ATP-dependent Zn protease
VNRIPNEEKKNAALLASRKNKEKVGSAEFDEAIDRVVGGLQKKTGDEFAGERNCRLS